MRILAAVLALLWAGPALAQASACAGLPDKGLVAQRRPVTVVPARPTAQRGWRCEAGYVLNLQGRMPMCSGSAAGAVAGNPQAACYAAMPFGPLAPVAALARPTRSCVVRKIPAVVRLEGENIGWSDAVVSVVPGEGTAIVPLAAADKGSVEENPVVQGCFAWNCRLVKLEVGAAAPGIIELRVAVSGRIAATEVVLVAGCPDPALR